MSDYNDLVDLGSSEPEVKTETLAPQPHTVQATTTTSTCCFSSIGACLQRIPEFVLDLIYWRDVVKSGVVFGVGFLSLLLLIWYSFISVVSYMTLLLITMAMGAKLYTMVMRTLNKTQDDQCPYIKGLMDAEITLEAETVHSMVDSILSKVNCSLLAVRRLVLIEDIVESIKFGLVLWCCTYVGAWFNGLTLIILGYTSLFTLPKVYETYKDCIDQYLALVHTQVNDVMTKVKGMIPIGNKEKAQ